MEWKTEYSLGILEVDDQHKGLLRIFSSIEKSIELNSGWSDVHFGLVRLKGLARSHFEFEEALMRLYRYDDSTRHGDQHREFFTRLAAIERRSLEAEAGTETLEFLCDWLKNHIGGSDRGYANHILSGAPIVRSDP